MMLMNSPGLIIFGGLKTRVHVKDRSMLLRRCFDDAEFLAGSLCSLYLTPALRLVSLMKSEPQEQYTLQTIYNHIIF